jgi:hypothetical protein
MLPVNVTTDLNQRSTLPEPPVVSVVVGHVTASFTCTAVVAVAGQPPPPSPLLPLVEVPLVEVPLVEVPLVEVPLVDVPLVDVPLVDVPLVLEPDVDMSPLLEEPLLPDPVPPSGVTVVVDGLLLQAPDVSVATNPRPPRHIPKRSVSFMMLFSR